MAQIDTALRAFLALLASLLKLILSAIAVAEIWLRGELRALGVPPNLQTGVLVLAAILMLLLVWRVAAGILRLLLVVLLVLVALHLLYPALPA